MLVYPDLSITHSLLLIAAAVIPALFLLIRVYKSDRLEPESPSLLRSLIIAGVLSALLALVEEMVLEYVLNIFVSEGTLLYNILLFYGIVAVSEESSKYLLMKRKTWNNPEFDCRFDGVLYAIFVSLGFALWENVSYVLSYGFSVAIVRALTAIPGHACFGVFMGVFYALAKEYDYKGNKSAASLYRKLAVLVPVFLHGSYDFIATMDNMIASIVFIVFIISLFLISNNLVGRMAKEDKYLTWRILD